jgi:hypothetical protein
MSSIQFNYFADEEGERIIRNELLDSFESLCVRENLGNTTNVVEYSIEKISDFIPPLNKRLLITSDKVKKHIIEDEDRFVSTYISPVIEYSPSIIRDENIYVAGRLVYFAGNEFPEFKKEVQSLFRKLKKHCWKDKHWQGLWVFETIGDKATVFIPNRVVYLKKE